MKKLLFAFALAIPMLFISASAEPPREGYELMFADEIDCRDLFDGKDARERIVEFMLE